MYPIGCEKISASIPSVRLSPASDSLSLLSGKTSFLFGAKRLKNETRFLSDHFGQHCVFESRVSATDMVIMPMLTAGFNVYLLSFGPGPTLSLRKPVDSEEV